MKIILPPVRQHDCIAYHMSYSRGLSPLQSLLTGKDFVLVADTAITLDAVKWSCCLYDQYSKLLVE